MREMFRLKMDNNITQMPLDFPSRQLENRAGRRRMRGTAVFAHIFADMLRNYIFPATSAGKKRYFSLVEILRQKHQQHQQQSFGGNFQHSHLHHHAEPTFHQGGVCFSFVIKIFREIQLKKADTLPLSDRLFCAALTPLLLLLARGPLSVPETTWSPVSRQP